MKPHAPRSFVVPLPCRGSLDCSRPLIMGVLNVTPDSFSDGGLWLDRSGAVTRGLRLAADGADIVDVGGESTRPGAVPVDAREEMRRVIPVVRALVRRGVIVSIDTSKSAVAAAGFAAGARILNDVSALEDPAMARLAARARVAVILMHRKGTPETMQRDPRYRDVVGEILSFLRAAVRRAVRAGIDRRRILVDPGIGFGKRPEHNLEIFRRLPEFRALRCPVVVGPSRKSFIGHYLGRPVEERLFGTAAAVAAAVLGGAHIVRVHDLPQMADVARMASHLR